MKTFNNISQHFTDKEYISDALREATKGGKKKKRYLVQNALFFSEETIEYIQYYITHFENDKHTPKVIYDGVQRKKRKIIVPSLREQIVHHVVVDSFYPMFTKGLYEYSYGSLPHRGVHIAKKNLQRWIRKDPYNFQYILKLDIKKYFENIPHDILKAKLSREVKDKKALEVMFKIIDVTNKGLPLGFYTSQWLSMWYLKDFDHFVKEQCYAPHYMRYMDDMIIAGADKEALIETFRKVKEYLKTLGLELNPKSQLFQFCWYDEKGIKHGRDIDFMGFRFYKNKTVVRKSIMIKMTRKAKNVFINPKPTLYQLKQLISYMSYIENCKIYNIWLDYIKPVYEYKKARKRIGNNDRKVNKILSKRLENKINEMFELCQQGKIYPILKIA